jgi:membrane protease subunit (stomatin/prohibitin family)
MGLARFIGKQFIDVIQWTEDSDDVLAWRFPTADLEIQQGAALIVRETEMAVFVDEGRIADRFNAGRWIIRTQNLPVLTDLRHWAKKFESPFKSEVYFFSTRLRVGQTFGTPEPITVRDREFGAVRVRAFGVYSFRISDPSRFHLQLSGTRDVFTIADLEAQLRAVLTSALAQHLGTSEVPFLDMAANQQALAAGVRTLADAACTPLGLAIEDVQIQSLSLPDELQQRLDERIGMGVVGDLGRYTQFQTARAIPLAAREGGGAAGAGVGVGAGVAMGQAMAQAIAAAGSAPGGAPAAGPSALSPSPSAATETARACPHCQAPLERATPFCPECGNALA